MVRLEGLREEKNLTSKEMAKILNVSPAIYSNWENEKDFIPTKRLYDIANFFEINIDYLLGLTNKKINIKSNKTINKINVAKNCREIRNSYNESLRKFVKRINTSNSTWSAYETGKTLILSSFLISICENSKYSIDWVLDRTDSKYRE